MNNLELVKYTVLFSVAVACLFYLFFNTTKNRAKLLAKELTKGIVNYAKAQKALDYNSALWKKYLELDSLKPITPFIFF